MELSARTQSNLFYVWKWIAWKKGKVCFNHLIYRPVCTIEKWSILVFSGQFFANDRILVLSLSLSLSLVLYLNAEKSDYDDQLFVRGVAVIKDAEECFCFRSSHERHRQRIEERSI